MNLRRKVYEIILRDASEIILRRARFVQTCKLAKKKQGCKNLRAGKIFMNRQCSNAIPFQHFLLAVFLSLRGFYPVRTNQSMSGGHGLLEPLLPIPNRTVKRESANDSGQHARESRSLPDSYINARVLKRNTGVFYSRSRKSSARPNRLVICRKHYIYGKRYIPLA